MSVPFSVVKVDDVFPFMVQLLNALALIGAQDLAYIFRRAHPNYPCPGNCHFREIRSCSFQDPEKYVFRRNFDLVIHFLSSVPFPWSWLKNHPFVLLFPIPVIFIDMNKEKHNQHLRIRLTETQLKSLIKKVIDDETTKSQLIRDIINDYTKQDNEK